MTKAETLLNSLDESDQRLYAVENSETTETEEHIVIGKDRYITVPDNLKRIAVQYDHDIETVTFDCPRYWDGKDMSTMRVYINYLRPDGTKDSYVPKTVTVDTDDSSIMHFDWTISRNVTQYKGPIVFLVCIKKTDEEGNISIHWNTELNKDLYISEGMECEEEILEKYPDIINQLLERQENVDYKINCPRYSNGNVSHGTRGQILQTNGDGSTQWVDAGTGSSSSSEIDPTVYDWAKQPNKPTYTADEVGAEPSGTAVSKVNEHDTSDTAHYDIRELVTGLAARLNALMDSDDTTLDQLSEIVTYIKYNKSLIDSITTSKVSVSDIINNLTSNNTDKPLSAKQGRVLKSLIDTITIPEKLPNPNALSIAVNGTTKTYDGSEVVTIDIASGSTDNSGDTNHYYVTPEQFGAVGDGTTDDTEAFRQAIETEYPIICMPGKDYYFVNEIVTSKTRINIDGNYSHLTAFRLKINLNDDETNWKSSYPHPDSVIQNIYFINKNNMNYCIKTGIPIKFVNIDIYGYDLWLKNYGDYMDYMVFDNLAINSRPSNNSPCIELTYLGDNHVFRECRFGGYDSNINYVQVSGCKSVNFIDCIINGNVTVYQSVVNFNGCHFENEGEVIIGDANLNSVINFNGCFLFDQYTLTPGAFYRGCGILVNYRAYGGKNDYMALDMKECIIFCSTESANSNSYVRIDDLKKNDYPNVVYSGNKVVHTPVVLKHTAKTWGLSAGTYTYKFFQSCNPYSIDYGDPDYSTGEESVTVDVDTSAVQFRSNYDTYPDMFIHAYRTSPEGTIMKAIIQITGNYIYDYGEMLNGVLWKDVDSIPTPKSTTAIYRNGVYYSGKNYTNAKNCICVNKSDGSISYMSE